MDNIPIWILMDGTNYVHRDFHAAGADRCGHLMRGRLATLQEDFDCERIVVAFDLGESFRRLIAPSYKANRKEKPRELTQALEDAKEACIAEAVDLVEVDTYEADDLIATFCRMARSDDRRVVIGSSDKDLHQLLERDWVTQLVAVRRERNHVTCTWMTADKLVSKYGVRPDQWVDYRVMVGDTSDNIAGIRNVGPSAARRVLQSVDSLAGFYANPFDADVTQAVRTRLFNAERDVDELRRLIELDRYVPLPEAWSAA